ncbi:MAG: FHA domain-containing protein [Deltaproteobacteria bacterium]|nr:FHA domain-containing protein [Deltaproteobacteria bacterium]
MPPQAHHAPPPPPPPQQHHMPPPQQHHMPPPQQHHMAPPQQHHMPPPQQPHMPPPPQPHMGAQHMMQQQSLSAPVPQQSAYLGALTAIYQGERTSVNKEKFIIGRGRQTSDLTIKDPNVSRQHAMVEFQNGVYYMVDLGSTNGVEYQGQRVTRKAIAEGDVFRICDHDVLFTYR